MDDGGGGACLAAPGAPSPPVDDREGSVAEKATPGTAVSSGNFPERNRENFRICGPDTVLAGRMSSRPQFLAIVVADGPTYARPDGVHVISVTHLGP